MEQELDITEEFQFPDMAVEAPADPMRVNRLSTYAALASSDKVTDVEFAEEYDELKVNYHEVLRNGGENEVRSLMEDKLRRDTETLFSTFAMETLEDTRTDEQIKSDLVAGTLDILDANQKEKPYALEELAINKIEALSLSDESQMDYEEWLLDDNVSAEINDTIREYVRRSMVLAGEYEKVAQESEDQNWFFDALDFLGRWVPTNSLTASSNIIDEVNTTGSVRAGENIGELTSYLYSKELSPEEFDAKVPEVMANLREQSGYIGENKSILNDLMASVATGAPSFATQKLNEETVGDLLLSMPLGSIARRSSALTARLLGNRKLAKEVSVNDILKDTGKEGVVKGQIEQGTEAAIEEALPSVAKTEQRTVNDFTPGIGGVIKDTLDEIKTATANIQAQLGELARLEAPELAEMVQKEVKKVRDSYGKRALPFDILPSREQGIHFVNMAIGKTDGSMYKNAAEAEKGAKRLNLFDYTIQQGDHGHYISVKHNMDESPYYKAWKEDEVASKIPFLHFIRSPDSFNPEVITQLAAQASFKKSNLFKQFNTIKNKYSGLPKKELGRVDDIATLGNYRNKWFTPEEFINEYVAAHKQAPKAREVIAYQAMKEVHDMNWGVLNWAERTKLIVGGWKAVNLKTPVQDFKDVIVKPVETKANFENTIIYKTNDDKVLYGREMSQQALEEMMEKEGLVLYKVYDDMQTTSGTPYNHLLIKKGDESSGSLLNVVPYRAGGPRAYEGNFFIKQFNTKSVDGKTIISNPLTFMVGRSRTELKESVENMEKARQLYNKGELTDELADELTPFNTVKKFDAQVRRGNINTRHPFVIVKGDESPISGADLKRMKDEIGEGNTIDLSMDGTGPNRSQERSGRLLFSRRGATLRSATENKAPIIRPSEMIQQVSEQLLTTASFTDFKLSAINRWTKTYGGYLDTNLSPQQAFWHGNLDGAPDVIKQQATASREAIKRIMNAGSNESRLWSVAVNRLADWVDGKGFGETSAKILSTQDKDPINALKGMAFDLKLGLFDPSQLVIQTQTIAAMASLRNPVTAVKFAYEGGLLRLAHVNQSDELLSYLAKKSGMEVEEFKLMGKEMRSGGYLDVNGEHILTDHHSSAVYGVPGSVIHKVRDAGRIPFFEAERLNRAYGYRMAWDDLRREYKTTEALKKALNDGSARRILAAKTNDYTMNMLTSSAAAYQKGILAVPSQFMSYQLRMMENIFFSKRFTPTERIRLGVGQILLYGSAGIPFGRYMAESTIEATGVEFDESTVEQGIYRLIAGGLIDSSIYMLSTGKVDLAFSDRAAVGKGIENVVKDIFGWGVHQKSMADILFGAATSVGGQVMSDAFKSIQYAAAAASSEQVGATEVTPEIVKAMAENISTASRAMRAYYVFKYNVWASQETGKALTFASTAESVAAAFGIPLREVADLDVLAHKSTNRQEFLKEYGQPVVKLRQEAFRALHDGDEETYYRKLKVSMALLQVHDIEDRYAIIDWANNKAGSKTVVNEIRDRFMQKFPDTSIMQIEED